MDLFRCCSSAIRRINCGIAAVAERTQQTDDVRGSRRYKVFCKTVESTLEKGLSLNFQMFDFAITKS